MKNEEKNLENKIRRDVVFIILGSIFLAISIISAYMNKDNTKAPEKKAELETVYKI